MKTKRINKWLKVHYVQGYYEGTGWEDLAGSENRKEAREDLKAYRENQPGAYRLISRRELNPEYIPKS